MTRIITGLILIIIGFFVLSNGGLPLIAFLTLAGCLSFYEIKKILNHFYFFLMFNNIVF